MKYSNKKKLTKGMPSAVVLSILIHAGLFLLAGMLVVFTVVKKEEKKFEPPKAVDRPKMKLRKPKVKVKKTSRGKQLKIPLAKLSPDDRKYLELENPPRFSIDFVKLSDNQLSRYEQSPSEIKWGRAQPRVNDFTFGAKVKQRSAGEYNHELTLEYFAIGKERIGDKHILLDRKSSTFIPTQENGRSHGFRGESIEFVEYDVDGDLRGKRPSDNLVTITDARGRIIQHSASKSWLWENIEDLKRLPVGTYMDKTCARAYPTSPKPIIW